MDADSLTPSGIFTVVITKHTYNKPPFKFAAVCNHCSWQENYCAERS